MARDRNRQGRKGQQRWVKITIGPIAALVVAAGFVALSEAGLFAKCNPDVYNADCLSVLANLSQLIGIPIAAVALGIAAYQLRDAANTAEKAEVVSEAQAVLALDALLSGPAFETLRRELNQGRVHVPNNDPYNAKAIELRRYVAAFERLGNLVEKSVVSIPLADELYGSRIQKLVTNAPYVRVMVTKDGAGRPGWRQFILLWNKMEERRGMATKPPATPNPPTM